MIQLPNIHAAKLLKVAEECMGQDNFVYEAAEQYLNGPKVTTEARLGSCPEFIWQKVLKSYRDESREAEEELVKWAGADLDVTTFLNCQNRARQVRLMLLIKPACTRQGNKADH